MNIRYKYKKKERLVIVTVKYLFYRDMTYFSSMYYFNSKCIFYAYLYGESK